MTFLDRRLEVDLTSGNWQFSPLNEEIAQAYLGGRGLNVKFLYDQLDPQTDPLSPANILTLSCGLLTGTAAPAASRLHVNALSPLTGLLGSSNVGGACGSYLRACGVQQLVIRGQAPAPVYLRIEKNAVEICDAQSIWGLDTYQTRQKIQKMPGSRKAKILAIGPGGENGCLFGCIMADGDHAAGRTGLGTVMGSKNLKAIVVAVQKPETSVKADGRVLRAIQDYARRIKNSQHYPDTAAYGGAGFVKWADDLGILATRNYRQNRFEFAAAIDGRQLANRVSRRHGCPRCPVQCKAELEFDSGRLKGLKAARPEFEPMLALGSKCGLKELEILVYLDNLCSRLGIDSISAGSAIAFAMDLYDRGIIDAQDTGGLDLGWGNGAAMEALIRQMAAGEGFGAVLAKGVRRAAEMIGRGADHYAPHVKGLELAGYHPDNIMGTALGYAVASRGADFNDIYATMEYKWLPEQAAEEFGTPQAADLNSIRGKAELVRRAMIVGTVLDGLGLCKVPALSLICAYDLVDEAKLVSALLGRQINVAQLFEAGERVATLERLFNIRHGLNATADRLPDMFFEKDYNAGRQPSKPQAWMEPMKQEFYRLMGWDAQGQPTEQTLARLDLLCTAAITETAA